jgi:FkbM family methyltransferase
MSKTLITYAQNREDLILYVLLHDVKKGFYVDVGANDPVIDSVTKFFYDRGWRGINIEPIHPIYQRIKRNRPRDITLNTAVSNKPGSLQLREYGMGKHGWSTLSDDIRQEHAGEQDYTDYEVPVKTLSEIFSGNKVTDIDFLKIDVEGFEYEVLSGNDWKHYRPKVIAVENTYPERWTGLLEKAGYTQVHFDGLNRYFVRNDLCDICTMDNYVPVLLSGAVIITAEQAALAKQLRRTQTWLKNTQQELSGLRKEHERLKAQLELVHTDPGKVLGGRKMANALARQTKRKITRKD